MSMGYDIIIGIDPDVDKSGWACYDVKREIMMLTTYKLVDIIIFLHESFLLRKWGKIYVVIEAGWLNKSNWHYNENTSKAAAAQIGARTGANWEIGKQIEKACIHYGIEYKLVKPTRSKVKAEAFNKLFDYKGRTNQEQRDAAMLIAPYVIK